MQVLACTHHAPLFLAAYSAAFDNSLPLRLQRFESVRETLLQAVRAALAAVMRDCKDMMHNMVGAVAAQGPGCQVVLHTGLTCKVPIRGCSLTDKHWRVAQLSRPSTLQYSVLRQQLLPAG